MNDLLSSLTQRLERVPGGLALVLPGGQRVGPTPAQVTLQMEDRLAVVALATGDIGAVGAAMVEGRVRWQGSLRALMVVATAMLQADPARVHPVRWWQRVMVRARSMAAHTLTLDAKHIQFHYDLSDAFFQLWLDPRRVYSCAYYRSADMGLAQAQEAKLDHICRKLRLQAGERFLDVGAGWGGLLLWAAEHYGVDATGITLSNHQHAYVTAQIAQRGLGDRVRVHLLDYRALEVAQPFDKIASVGMFEHVGRAHMPVYFDTLHRLLRPGGLLLNHGITAGGVDIAQLGAGMGDFIERYIFPGGELLHISTVLHDLAQGHLEMVDTENLRPHYARTLWAWSDALEAQLPQAAEILDAQYGAEQGAKALRAYRLYLAGSALGFEQGWIALHQMLATRPDGDVHTGTMVGAQSDYPFQRDYMYPAARSGLS